MTLINQAIVKPFLPYFSGVRIDIGKLRARIPTFTALRGDTNVPRRKRRSASNQKKEVKGKSVFTIRGPNEK